MKLLRLMGDLTQLRREFNELSSESTSEEEQAKYELTASARRFSRHTKRVVDDKLSFSATLMRAGEVHAANRLLEEVEVDVRTEEAALIEKMNEVKVARATTRERMTRVRLTRMLAVSVAGSLLMGFSALGMAAAGFVEEREQDQIRRNAAAQRRALEAGGKRGAAAKLKTLDRKVRKVLLAGDVPVGALNSLTAAEIRQLGVLTQGAVDVGRLQSFLVRVLPTPDIAFQVVERLAGRVDRTVSAAADAGPLDIAAPRAKRKAQRAANEAQTEESASQPEPGSSPTPEETEQSEETTEEEREGRQQETGGGNGEEEPGGTLPGGTDNPLEED